METGSRRGRQDRKEYTAGVTMITGWKSSGDFHNLTLLITQEY